MALLGAVGIGLGYWSMAPLDTARTWPLTIESSARAHAFTVELAITPAQQQQGLMFRQTLDDDAGMLFVYDRPQVRSMWMKNTPLSLDMLFLNADGIIRSIARSTTPFSQAHILGPRDTQYVLELRAGRSQALGIQTGDQVRNLPTLDQLSSVSEYAADN